MVRMSPTLIGQNVMIFFWSESESEWNRGEHVPTPIYWGGHMLTTPQKKYWHRARGNVEIRCPLIYREILAQSPMKYGRTGPLLDAINYVLVSLTHPGCIWCMLGGLCYAHAVCICPAPKCQGRVGRNSLVCGADIYGVPYESLWLRVIQIVMCCVAAVLD